MSEDCHPANLNGDELLAQCELKRVRRSGPGGQHRNKVETAVLLRHRATGIVAEANERRSVAENRRVALKRLRLRLALSVRREVRSDDFEPSELWASRCRNGRISVSADHADFPPLLAEALDVLEHREGDYKSAANDLAITGSQLIGLLKSEPRAFSALNDRRRQLGLRPLR